MFDIRIFEEIYFYRAPKKILDVSIQNIDKIEIMRFNKLSLSEGYNNPSNLMFSYLECPAIHHMDEFYIEIFENDNLIHEQLFFRNHILSYIDKKDLTIIIHNQIKIQKLIDYYSTYGTVLTEDSSTPFVEVNTKYFVVLKKYLLNIPYFLNTMFFNRKNIISNDYGDVIGGKIININNNDRLIINNLRYLNENIWI